MIVVYSGNQKVYPAIAASLCSLIEHNKVEKIYLVIEDDIFPYDVPEYVEVINSSNQTFFPKNGANFKCSYSYFTLLRAAYPLMFPQYDKILSLDCDTLILDDISDLWNTDIDNYYFCASKEPFKSKLIYPNIYTNVGVCLQNLKKLREDKKVFDIIEILNTKYYRWPDQDVMNEVCKGFILDMPAEYNPTPWTQMVPNEKIKHYAGWGFDQYIKQPEFVAYISKISNKIGG